MKYNQKQGMLLAKELTENLTPINSLTSFNSVAILRRLYVKMNPSQGMYGGMEPAPVNHSS